MGKFKEMACERKIGDTCECVKVSTKEELKDLKSRFEMVCKERDSLQDELIDTRIERDVIMNVLVRKSNECRELFDGRKCQIDRANTMSDLLRSIEYKCRDVLSSDKNGSAKKLAKDILGILGR